MSVEGSSLEGEDSSSTKKDFGHEKPVTLSNAGALADRSVMWPIPNPRGFGSRSEGHFDDTMASGVTPIFDALHQKSSGATVAVVASPRQLEAAEAFVTEEEFVDEEGSSAKEVIDGAVDGQRRFVREGFEIVKKARSVMAEDADLRTRKKHTKPGQNTVAQYRRKCAIFDDLAASFEEPEVSPTLLAMAHYAPRKGSFYAMRAAIRHRALENMKRLIAEQDVLQRQSKTSTAWEFKVLELKAALSELTGIDAMTQEACLAHAKRGKENSSSKRRLLPWLVPNWRDIVGDAANQSATYRLPTALMRACGLRPSELEAGVELEWVNEGLMIRIRGAKVRETAGQEWRAMSLSAAALPAWVRREVEGRGTVIVSVNRDAMRAYLWRMSADVGERLRDPTKKATTASIIISGYCFRHALVTDLRGQGWSEAEIAASIGESVAETARHYGERGTGALTLAVSVAIVRGSVDTARPVRPLDSSGLEQIVAKKRKAVVRPH